MKAFLSHSSKDKWFVRPVADELGDGQCELDERTFEYTLNVRAIRNALDRTDLFVLFLSADSVGSTYIAEEVRTALEHRGAGVIKKVAVFSIDGTSYKALPDWLRDVNVVQRVSSSKACARRIQAMLVALEAEDDATSNIFVDREQEAADLRKALSGPPARTPVALHVVGHHGVGRRSLLRNILRQLFPRRFGSFLEISLSQGQGVEELYRQLYGLSHASSIDDTIRDFTAFAGFGAPAQAKTIASMLEELRADDEFVIIVDEGGIYTDKGDYQAYLAAILEEVDGHGLPAVAFVQTRMMPTGVKVLHPRSHHLYVSTFEDVVTRELLGLLLKQLKVDYTEEQIESAAGLLDGHPFNINFGELSL